MHSVYFGHLSVKRLRHEVNDAALATPGQRLNALYSFTSRSRQSTAVDATTFSKIADAKNTGFNSTDCDGCTTAAVLTTFSAFSKPIELLKEVSSRSWTPGLFARLVFDLVSIDAECFV